MLMHADNCDEDPAEVRQKNEIQALQAIYMDDFVSVVLSNDEEEWRSPEFILLLKPQQGLSQDEIHATANLHIKFCPMYPKVMPSVVKVENSHGVSSKDVEQLQSELEELCKSREGEEVVFLLAGHTQAFLAERNQKPRFRSFHDEMLAIEKNKIERFAQEEQSRRLKEHEQQMIALTEEFEKKKNELRRSKALDAIQHPMLEIKFAPSKRASSGDRNERRNSTGPDSPTIEHPVCDRHGKVQQIRFSNKDGGRVYHVGSCMGSCQAGRFVCSAMEVNLRESAAITTLKIPCQNPESRRKQMALIEQEFRSLQRIHHPSLVPYLALKWEIQEEEESLNIYVAEQFVAGLSLSFYVNRNIGVNVEVLRHITGGVLKALQALHKANVVHKNLRHSNVYVDNTGEVRVSGYSLESRMNEILTIQDDRPSLTIYPSAPGRGGKRQDIYRLGLLLWTLFQGNVVRHIHRDHARLPSAMPLPLRDFVSKCIGSEEKDRLGIDDLLSHGFLKATIHRAILEPEESQEESQDQPHHSVAPFFAAPSNVVDAPGGRPSVFPSRLLSEFETLQFLGSGGFGDVLKVKNKLDGNIYAIKRILLDAKSRQLNRKITREVKLLSRLNHENIVRYYNSWLETVNTEPQPANTQSSNGDAAEDLAADSDSSLFASPNKGRWFAKPSAGSRSSSSGGIAFEADSDALGTSSSEDDSSKEEEEDTVDAPASSSSPSVHPTSLQFMYIQMEYCEKSTLRTAIDSELYLDKTRIWRLFREIVEGLAYIHTSGIIHRDLKPVNIFLDFRDHVKIGDFGLATSSRLHGLTGADVPDGFIGTPSAEKSNEVASSSGQLTGQIGTALYVAPELSKIKCPTAKAAYNQKVDIYSLGIIFFEMCFPPPATGMERIKVLGAIRQPNIILPDSDLLTTKEAQVITWLLNHNPASRPSSAELLQSPLLPPPQLEEAELQEMIRHTLSNTQSKAYKHLVASCFKQSMTPSEDVMFDMDFIAPAGLQQTAWIHQTIQEVFIRNCQRRGAIHLKTPALAPKMKDGPKRPGHSPVQLMNQAGSIVTLPADMHTPFARYISRANVSWLKRYSIDQAYNDRRLVSSHPKSSTELAFDIVTPSPSSILADAEVIATLSEVLHDPRLRFNRPIVLLLGHHLLLRAALIHCGIPQDKHSELCHALQSRSKSDNGLIYTRAAKLAVPRQSIDMLTNLLELEGNISKLSASLTNLTSRKGEAASLAKQALHELDAIASHAECMGLKCNLVCRVDGALHSYDAYSGIVFRFVCQSNLRKSKVNEVLATGGRYDTLVKSFQNPLFNRRKLEGDPATQPAVVGGSIHLDKVVTLLKETTESTEDRVLISCAVCTVGHRPQTKEQASLVRDLWNAGVRATVLDHCQSLEEVVAWCREKNVPHIVLLKDSEAGSARLKSWEKDRYTERKMLLGELIEHLTSSSEAGNDATDVTTGGGRLDGSYRSNSLSESSGNQATAGSTGASGSPVVNFHILVEEKLPVHARRRYEKQILMHLQSTLQNFNSRVQVDVVAIEATTLVIQSLLIALYVDPTDAKAVEQSIGAVIDKHRRQRKYLQRIYEQLFQLRFEKHVTVLVIYGLHDNSHRLLM